MPVQQGRLGSTDTTKNMANYYSDSVVSTIADVDRSLHNGTQFVRLVLRRPQPVTARGAASGSPDTQVEVEGWVDGLFTPIGPTSPSDIIVIGFGGRLVPTAQIKIFSTAAIDTTLAKWSVSTSLNNIDSEFTNASFIAAVTTVIDAIESTPNGNQFTYTLTVTSPSIDTTGNGLPWWRIEHDDAAAFAFVTEVEPLEPLTPTISYFDTDGDFASSFNFEQSNILDACYDTPNSRFYTIRFNTDNVGSSSINLSDDFSEAEAGSAASTNNFNPARWRESNSNTQFLRSSEKLVHNVAAGDGQLETTFTLAGNFSAEIDVNPISFTTDHMWFAIRALNEANNTIMSEGVGFDQSPTTTGVWFNSYIANFVDSSANADLREARPLFHNTSIGTDQFTVAYDGAVWAVSGTLTGALANAQTGAIYNETVTASTPIEFLISATNTPQIGDQFTFDLITATANKFPAESGTIGFSRTAGTWDGVQGLVTGASVSTEAVSIELYGNTNGTINLQADDFAIAGSGIFPQIAVLTVERADDEGDVIGSPLIESFDIIGDSSLTYNDFLDGRVQIACTSSGTGGGFVYIKANNVLYKYANNVSLGTDDGSSAIQTSTAQIPKDGTSSFNWTHASSIGGAPFLTYLEYNEILDIVQIKTLDKDTLLDTSDDKEVLLNISDYATNRYPVFFDQNDFDTMYYIDSGTNLRAFNLDDRISAFMAVNAEDTTLPAGTAQSTLVNADVINAWGESLNGKQVTFQVTAGDGAVTPSTDTTAGNGRATTQFTVGASVGVSTVTATVTEV